MSEDMDNMEEKEPMEEPGKEMDAGAITDDDRLWALLSWIFWIIAVLALLLEEKKDRPFVRYHAWHSIVTGIIFTIISVATFGCGTPVFLVSLYFAYRAYQGEWFTIPVLTDFIKGQGWA